MFVLQRHYTGDIRQLIGEPDVYLEETEEEKLSRTFWENGYILQALDPADQQETTRLRKLQLMLAERVFEIRREGNLNGQLRVGLLESQGIIEIILRGSRTYRTTFPYNEKVEQFAKMSGGYTYIIP